MARLKFKGDKPKPRERPARVDHTSPTPAVDNEFDDDSVVWTKASTVRSISGPILLYACSGYLLACSEDGEVTAEEMNPGAFESFTPERVHSVFLGYTPSKDVFCLKTCLGKYVSASGDGWVQAKGLVVSEPEKWEIVQVGEGKFAFRSALAGKYLSCSDGKINAYAGDVGTAETFEVKCQRRERRTEEAPKTNVAPGPEVSRETLLDRRVKQKHDKFC